MSRLQRCAGPGQRCPAARGMAKGSARALKQCGQAFGSAGKHCRVALCRPPAAPPRFGRDARLPPRASLAFGHLAFGPCAVPGRRQGASLDVAAAERDTAVAEVDSPRCAVVAWARSAAPTAAENLASSSDNVRPENNTARVANTSGGCVAAGDCDGGAGDRSRVAAWVLSPPPSSRLGQRTRLPAKDCRSGGWRQRPGGGGGGSICSNVSAGGGPVYQFLRRLPSSPCATACECALRRSSFSSVPPRKAGVLLPLLFPGPMASGSETRLRMARGVATLYIAPTPPPLAHTTLAPTLQGCGGISSSHSNSSSSNNNSNNTSSPLDPLTPRARRHSADMPQFFGWSAMRSEQQLLKNTRRAKRKEQGAERNSPMF